MKTVAEWKDKILLNFVVIASQLANSGPQYVCACGVTCDVQFVPWKLPEQVAGVSFAALLISNFEARLGHNFRFHSHTHIQLCQLNRKRYASSPRNMGTSSGRRFVMRFSVAVHAFLPIRRGKKKMSHQIDDGFFSLLLAYAVDMRQSSWC